MVARADLVVPVGFVFAVYMQRSCMVPSPLCSGMATFEIYYSKYQWKIVSIAFRPIHPSIFFLKMNSVQYVYWYFCWFSLFSLPEPPWPQNHRIDPESLQNRPRIAPDLLHNRSRITESIEKASSDASHMLPDASYREQKNVTPKRILRKLLENT